MTIKIRNTNTNQCKANLQGHGSHFTSVCQECDVTIGDSNGDLYYMSPYAEIVKLTFLWLIDDRIRFEIFE